MKKFLLIILFITNLNYAQTVSTFFIDDANITITDALIFDEAGNLYGSDFGNFGQARSVYKITPQGVITPFVTGIINPNGLAFDSEGNLFVCEYGVGNILKYDPNGILLETFNVGGFPSGLLKDFGDDNMIFTQTANSSINVLNTTTGTFFELAQGAPLNSPVGLAWDDDGNLYTGNFTGRQIYKISNVGALELIATLPDTDGADNAALAFITYANGKLWGTLYFGDNKIYSINPNELNDFSLFAGSVQGTNDGPIATATFDNPAGIVFNALENAFYISEFSSEGNVRKISDIPLAENSFTTNISLSVSPNPTSNILILQGTSIDLLGKITIAIYDIMGRLISQQNLEVTDNNFEISTNVSEFSTGIYFVKLQTNDGLFVSRKFIKK